MKQMKFKMCHSVQSCPGGPVAPVNPEAPVEPTITAFQYMNKYVNLPNIAKN